MNSTNVSRQKMHLESHLVLHFLSSSFKLPRVIRCSRHSIGYPFSEARCIKESEGSKQKTKKKIPQIWSLATLIIHNRNIPSSILNANTVSVLTSETKHQTFGDYHHWNTSPCLRKDWKMSDLVLIDEKIRQAKFKINFSAHAFSNVGSISVEQKDPVSDL